MSSITAIQQSDSLYGIFGTGNRAKADTSAVQGVAPKNDTVTLSEEALALLEKIKAQKAEEAAAEEEALRNALELADEQEAAPKTSLAEMGKKSLFAIMLESLFLADLEENSQAAAQAAEDGMPRKQETPLQDSAKSAGIKKLMQDVASGKADISDIPSALAMGSGGSNAKTGSVAAKQQTGTAAVDDNA